MEGYRRDGRKERARKKRWRNILNTKGRRSREKGIMREGSAKRKH